MYPADGRYGPADRQSFDRFVWHQDSICVQKLQGLADAGWDWDKVNVNGGGIALGHPIGASGARVIATLIYALKDRGLKRGLASLCLGGGEAVAMAIELEN